MQPFQRRILSALLLLLVAAVPVAAGADSMLFGQGLLWRVERSDAKASHVFGTMHSTDPRIVSLPAPVASAFEEADSVILELLFDDFAGRRAAEAMLLQKGRSLDRIVGADLFAKIADVGVLYRLSPEKLKRFKPWALAMMLCFTPTEAMRMANGEPVLDERLERQARNKGTAVYALETLEEQLRPLDDLSIQNQRRLLESVVDAHPQIEAFDAYMKQAYLDRDVEAILVLFNESSTGGDEALMRWFEDHLITQRNHRMAERLRPHLAEGGAFIAVGAGHLPGEEGILRLLEQQGHRITRVY